jgi:malate dehydrogenase
MNMKVSIIGAGNVGATAAMKIANGDFVNELVLLDVKEGVAEGKAMDIMQSLMMTNSQTIVTGTTGDYSKTANSDVIVITSGVPRKPGMTREELVGVNSKVMTMVLDGATKYSPNAIYVVVSNPMDTMTQMVVNYLGVDNAHRVIGMGGALDSARFKYNIYMKIREKFDNLYIRPHNILNCWVIGGHGDTTMIPLANKVTVLGKPLIEYLTKEEIDEVVEATMKGGATLTKMLGTSAWEAPAQGITEVVRSITYSEWNTIPSSVYHPSVGLCIGDLVGINKDGWDWNYEGSDESKEYMNEYAHQCSESVKAIRKVNEALS